MSVIISFHSLELGGLSWKAFPQVSLLFTRTVLFFIFGFMFKGKSASWYSRSGCVVWLRHNIGSGANPSRRNKSNM